MLTAYAKMIGLLVCFTALDIVWWGAIDRRLRVMRGARLWRVMLAMFMIVMITYVVVTIFWAGPLRRSQGPVPIVVHTTAYLWHFITLPLATLLVFAAPTVRAFLGMRKRKSRQTIAPVATSQHNRSRIAPSRRQVLAAAAMVLPPVATGAIAIGACRSLYGFRLRSFTLPIPTLPPALDGMTIAHVSDTHIGKFLHPDRLPDIADAVNRLDADFIAFTGDLIDVALEDLPFGIDFLRTLKSRCGMVICEGNHDLMQDRGAFENSLREAGLPIIIGDQLTLPFTSRVGRSHPVRFLAVPWNFGDDAMYDSVDYLRPQLATDAFPILLAHHPHSFDAAALAGPWPRENLAQVSNAARPRGSNGGAPQVIQTPRFPLTLSGHTHGGQIMLTQDFGAGSIRFRYTSGLYQKPGANLIVNNGLGNWFPLRINAPAELVHITLRSV